jgi:hypothetical protein
MIRRLGKRPARLDHRTLRLVRYMGASLPIAPESCDLTARVTDLGMMLNDDLGDCTCAAAGHMIQAWTAAAGAQVIPADEAILAAYEGSCGYNPSDPSTDGGGVEIDVLNYWRKNGIGGHTIGAYASVNPKNIEEIKQSIYIFGAAYTGFDLPEYVEDADAWELPSLLTKLTSSTKPGSWGGHAVPLVAYDATHVIAISWGAYLRISWDFVEAYCDEIYAVLSKDQLQISGLTPAGFNNDQLAADLRLVA